MHLTMTTRVGAAKPMLAVAQAIPASSVSAVAIAEIPVAEAGKERV